ncbi:MAG TPA: universal stress protein [Acidimicrobiia bacterium]|nr:universal stress protein [Acidimicrobiia bacterium]
MTTKIVVGVDGSDSASRAIEWCARTARALDAEVIAVHAVEEPVYPVPTLAYVAVPPLSDEARAELLQLLEEQWCAPLRAAAVTYRAELVDGPAASALVQVAESEGADLLVTGRRGRGGFAELVLGSTSHHLTHHAGRPLVIVP